MTPAKCAYILVIKRPTAPKAYHTLAEMRLAACAARIRG